MSGVDEIAKERATHEARGYTAAADDQWENSELAKAAMCYISPFLVETMASWLWPWENRPPTMTFSLERRIEQLAKAGALVAAEIDRLERFAEVQQARDDEQVGD
jgi:hypothetical protein